MNRADDAILLPLSQPAIEGKAAIRAFVDASFHTPDFSIRWASRRVSADGTFVQPGNKKVPWSNGTAMTVHSRGVA